MYNLIVTAEENAWEGSRYSMDLSRLGEYTATALVERLGLPAKFDIDQLMALPTLFAYEHFREAPARVGRVTRIRHSGNRVPFEYELDQAMPPISHERIAGLEWELDITKWEMNRTHWAVKDVDLIEALAEAGLVRQGSGLLTPAAPTGASKRVANALRGLDAAYVSRQWELAVGRIETDPAGAITLARSLLESVLKHLMGNSARTSGDTRAFRDSTRPSPSVSSWRQISGANATFDGSWAERLRSWTPRRRSVTGSGTHMGEDV